MSFDFVFSLLNCSYESATHLVQEVQLIQPLQAKKKNSHESAGENEQKKKKRPWRWELKICCCAAHQTSPGLQTYGPFSPWRVVEEFYI